MSDRIISSGALPLALPNLRPEDWCHAECYARWTRKSKERQGILGGHIHYDEAEDAWSVPFPVALHPAFAELSIGGVIRPML